MIVLKSKFQIKKNIYYLFKTIYHFLSNSNTHIIYFCRLDNKENREMRTKIQNRILVQITGTADCKERVKNTEKKPLFHEFRRPGAETLNKAGENRILILKCRANLATPRKETKDDEVTCSLATVLMTKKSECFSLYKDIYNHHFSNFYKSKRTFL